MAGRRALVLLLVLTACTSGGARRAAPTPAAPATMPPSTASPATSDDDPSPDPEPSYRPLPEAARLTGFVPRSVSFVSTRTGWFLGTQTCARQTCGVLLQTRDGGRTFVRRLAPPVNVASIRFADLREGWAFGNGRSDTQGDPGLWRTHDGGSTWKKVLPNPVPSLEIGGGTAWAIVLDLGGTFPQVFRGGVHSDALTLVTQAGNRSAVVTVGRDAVYVVAQQGAGPIATTLLVLDVTGQMHRRPSPCRGPYEQGFGATDLQVAPGGPGRLVAVCSGEPSTGSQFKVAYRSTDRGRTWVRLPNPPEGGYASRFGGTLAATSSRAFAAGSRSALNVEEGSGPWRSVLLDDDGTGFSFVGFTDDAHGVALGQQAGWMTADAGDHWRRLRFG